MPGTRPQAAGYGTRMGSAAPAWCRPPRRTVTYGPPPRGSAPTTGTRRSSAPSCSPPASSPAPRTGSTSALPTWTAPGPSTRGCSAGPSRTPDRTPADTACSSAVAAPSQAPWPSPPSTAVPRGRSTSRRPTPTPPPRPCSRAGARWASRPWTCTTSAGWRCSAIRPGPVSVCGSPARTRGSTRSANRTRSPGPSSTPPTRSPTCPSTTWSSAWRPTRPTPRRRLRLHPPSAVRDGAVLTGGRLRWCRPAGGGPLGGGERPSWTPYFQVTDLDGAVAQVERLGGSVRREAVKLAGLGRAAKLTDPLRRPLRAAGTRRPHSLTGPGAGFGAAAGAGA